MLILLIPCLLGLIIQCNGNSVCVSGRKGENVEMSCHRSIDSRGTIFLETVQVQASTARMKFREFTCNSDIKHENFRDELTNCNGRQNCSITYKPFNLSCPDCLTPDCIYKETICPSCYKTSHRKRKSEPIELHCKEAHSTIQIKAGISGWSGSELQTNIIPSCIVKSMPKQHLDNYKQYCDGKQNCSPHSDPIGECTANNQTHEADYVQILYDCIPHVTKMTTPIQSVDKTSSTAAKHIQTNGETTTSTINTPDEQHPPVSHNTTPDEQHPPVSHNPTPDEQHPTVSHNPTPDEQHPTVSHDKEKKHYHYSNSPDIVTPLYVIAGFILTLIITLWVYMFMQYQYDITKISMTSEARQYMQLDNQPISHSNETIQ
ncbi:unnamed protein product [Owenia fusiformis]|uniref:Uncharacterized protein n=1 Tax=Owenia fusiformis TaxID=6347 RepID=A0A8J1Y6C4_OWEFU|nr:unnamed protein product [Owenia fusiformis]